MKYEIIITEIDAATAKSILASQGKALYEGVSPVQPADNRCVQIALKEHLEEPDIKQPWYLTRHGQEQYENDLAIYKRHHANLSVIPCSAELQKLLLEKHNAGITIVEEDKDFELSTTRLKGSRNTTTIIAIPIESETSQKTSADWDEVIKESGFMSEYVDRLHLLNWLKENYNIQKK